MYSICVLFKQADMPCLDCREKGLKSLLTFAVAPLSHARVCKEIFCDDVSVCVCVYLCTSTVAPILISNRNYVLEMAMKSSLVSLFLIPVFYFRLPYSLFSNSFPFGFSSFLTATECV